MRYIFKKFRLGRQEDAHEFLRFFIEALQKSIVTPQLPNAEKLNSV